MVVRNKIGDTKMIENIDSNNLDYNLNIYICEGVYNELY